MISANCLFVSLAKYEQHRFSTFTHDAKSKSYNSSVIGSNSMN